MTLCMKCPQESDMQSHMHVYIHRSTHSHIIMHIYTYIHVHVHMHGHIMHVTCTHADTSHAHTHIQIHTLTNWLEVFVVAHSHAEERGLALCLSILALDRAERVKERRHQHRSE